MSKFRISSLLVALSITMALCGCGTENKENDEPAQIEAETLENDMPAIATDTVDDVIVEMDNKEDANTEAQEEDLTGLPYVEVEPILDLLDDVWGKNWLEWTPEDFIKEFDVVIPSEENNWTSPPGVGVKHATIDSEESFSINEDGFCDAFYDVKSIGTYDTGTSIRRRYNRILRFPGEMNEDPMSMYFSTCEGCVSNDCSKCRNIDCDSCENNKCENTEEKECDGCIIKDCTDLLNYWGIDGPCEIATEYGKAALKMDKFEDAIYITINQFSKYKDLEIIFTDGYGGATFSKLFISVSVDDKTSEKNNGYADANNTAINSDSENGEEKLYDNPYARSSEDDEATINELRTFLKNNGIDSKFYSMYSTWKQLYNKDDEDISEQEWLNRFGQYLNDDEF